MTAQPPLFIVGAPRSGNTLTRRVLVASGQIYIPPETYVLGEIISRWPSWRGLHWREKIWLICAHFERHNHFEDFEIASFSPYAIAAHALPEHKRTLRGAIDALYAFMAEQHGFTQARWGDKTPWNTMHLKDIVKAYPDAHYLHLKRHGLDVVASQVKAGMRDIPGSAQRWVDANAACIKHLKRARRAPLTVAYEDLVTSPDAVFRAIFDWCSLGFESDYLSRVPSGLADVDRHAHHAAVNQPITAGSIGRWRESLDANDLTALPPTFNQMMSQLGYEPTLQASQT